MLGQGKKSWFFLTVDYAFGRSLEKEATALIEASGGRVVGSARFPLCPFIYTNPNLNESSLMTKACVHRGASLWPLAQAGRGA